MSERQAWFCPSCQKHHGPHVDTCPGLDAAPYPILPPVTPTQWELTEKPQCRVCGIIWDGAMGYVCAHPRCPSLVTCSITVETNPNMILVN